jgi:hypothetical protein
MSTIETREEDRRRQAIERLDKRSEFVNHAVAFVLVNALLVTIWFMTGGGFFWPIFPLFGWGIGLFFHALDVFRPPYSEERIRREMDRLP